MKIMQFEYKALNLFDEISTVEITLDYINGCIHLFDKDGALFPQYNFSTKQYEPNDEFWKMKETIEQKHLAATFFEQKKEGTKWLFYTPQRDVYCVSNNNEKYCTKKITKDDTICLPQYINRLKFVL